MRVAFVGKRGLGGVVMRGQSVAKKMGVEFLDVSEFPTKRAYDCIVLVKYWLGKASAIRKSCDRLIFDPLDCWMSTKPRAVPDRFWKWCMNELSFDDIIATSKACAVTMDKVGATIHLLPHHCDGRVTADFYDPLGPVVYSGGLQFVRPEVNNIRDACAHLGKKFVIRSGRGCQEALEGASLCLHLRLWPEDTMLNKWCKPQVKLENAKAAGLPMLATRHPCVSSSVCEGVVWSQNYSDWAERVAAALEAPRLKDPMTLDRHVSVIENIIRKL